MGPFLTVFLGREMVPKPVSKILLFAFCPPSDRFLCPDKSGGFSIKLPRGFTDTVGVTLAIEYMEKYVLDERYRRLPWKVRGDIAVYISMAEVFNCLNEFGAAHQDLRNGIYLRLCEMPLSIEQIKSMWRRENPNSVSKYGKRMAANIATYMCVLVLEIFVGDDESADKTDVGARLASKVAYLAMHLPYHYP